MFEEGSFEWTKAENEAFNLIKECCVKLPSLPYPISTNVEVECDASGVGIGAVLNQSKRPIAYFSEKLSDSRRKYSTYDKEFYAIVKHLTIGVITFGRNICPPFGPPSFEVHHGQRKLNTRHAEWLSSSNPFLLCGITNKDHTML
ncbi:uncharacterized protein LOC116140420 [Pistacia vera]|uniref:uncharacterized protein LOC116140420 n=1 Tax=Pistacia vera TaxID=55513 RepID=UPI00126333B4|nr:uncharacterized protein LOC116140420 [Pistacia vera]